MKRRLLNLVTMLSLLLSMAVVVLWVRSYTDWLHCSWSRRPHRVIVHVSRGAIVVSANGTSREIYYVGPAFQVGRKEPSDVTKSYTASTFAGRSAAGFVVGRVTNADYRYSFVVGAPLWATFLLFTAMSVVTLASGRRRRRRRPGHCVRCGYDLTGNVSGVCPECGKGNEVHT